MFGSQPFDFAQGKAFDGTTSGKPDGPDLEWRFFND